MRYGRRCARRGKPRSRRITTSSPCKDDVLFLEGVGRGGEGGKYDARRYHIVDAAEAGRIGRGIIQKNMYIMGVKDSASHWDRSYKYDNV